MKRLYKKSDDTQNNTQQNTTEQNVDNMQQNSAEQNDSNGNAKDIINGLLKRIDESSEDIKDAYYSLLDNLNALDSSYPEIYTELKYLVKFPTDAEIRDVANLKDDVEKGIEDLNKSDLMKNIK